ncbi:MAG: type III-B CRISPR module-associated protein Cmr3 [Pirellula sp.]
MSATPPKLDSKLDKKSWFGLLFDPLDVLLFRDGRPFGEANRVVSQLPFPQTIAGAIRTALLRNTGFDFKAFSSKRQSGPNEKEDGDAIVNKLLACGAKPEIVHAEFRGPWLAKKSMNSDGDQKFYETLFPFPANLKESSNDPDRFLISRPVSTDSVPGWHHPKSLRPLKFSGQPNAKADTKLLTLSGLLNYLQAFETKTDVLDFATGQVVDPKELYLRDFRVGNRIDPERLATADRELYGVGFLALQRDARIYVEINTTTQVVDQIRNHAISIGGEGKYSHVEVCEACDFPTYDASLKRTVWYLATPTFLDPSHHRPIPKSDQGSVVSAASGFGIGVSGWDVTRGGPKKTKFAIPAGAIYFLDGPGSAVDFINNDGSEHALLQEGWGFAIQGNWSDMQ